MSLTDFGKMLKYQISRKSFCGSRVVSRGRTDGRAIVTKLIFAFRSFAKVAKNVKHKTSVI